MLADDGAGEFLCRQGLGLGAQDEALVGVVDEARSPNAGSAPGHVQDIGERQVVLGQPVGLHLHLKFLALAAEHGHF